MGTGFVQSFESFELFRCWFIERYLKSLIDVDTRVGFGAFFDAQGQRTVLADPVVIDDTTEQTQCPNDTQAYGRPSYGGDVIILEYNSTSFKTIQQRLIVVK